MWSHGGHAHVLRVEDRGRDGAIPSIGSRLAASVLGLVLLAESELTPVFWVVEEW